MIATIGLFFLLAEEGPSRWGLLAVPVLWCLVSGATLLAMGSPEAWFVLSATLLAVATALARGPQSP